jgi:uncharacterized RDD family membrane protein YckC
MQSTNKTNFDHLQLQSPEAIGIDMEIAGIGARSHAFVIDWHIRLLLALAWLLAIGITLFSFQGLSLSIWDDASTLQLYLWLLPAGILYFFYHPILEIAMSGRTPGKKMAGVKLVTLNGLTPNSGALLIRNVFRLLDSLPAFYILGLGSGAFTRHQVRIGDLAAGLVLVYDDQVHEKELEQVSQLALKSDLNPKNQALLLDIIKRWKQLLESDRIRLAEQFLDRIGKPVTDINPDKKAHEENLLTLLEQLAYKEKS